MSISNPDSGLHPQPWPAATVFNAEGRTPVLLVCEHASNQMPPDANNLGCSPEDLGRHIAVDLGAADLTRALALRMGAPAVLCTTSRLYVDCNRSSHDADWIPERSDGSLIPGNVGLNDTAREQRAQRVFEPFHQQVAQTLSALRKHHPTVLILPIHSFAASLNGQERPHAAVIWEQEWPASLMLQGLSRHASSVGNNYPYDGRKLRGHTFLRHAIPAGLPHFAIEVRQDLLAQPGATEHWAGYLADALDDVLAGLEKAAV
ncbi:TPA: N-formylglutamate amidohydrolase [Pseudomonas aeruginosa]